MDEGDFCDSVTVRESNAIDLLVFTGSRVEVTAEDDLPSNVLTIGSDGLTTGEDIESDELEVVESNEEGVTIEEKTAAQYKHLL